MSQEVDLSSLSLGGDEADPKLCEWRNDPLIETDGPSRSTSLVLGFVVWRPNNEPTKLASIIRLVSKPEESQPKSTTVLDQDLVDLGAVQDWLRCCDEEHGEYCRQGWWSGTEPGSFSGFVLNLRLIDCEELFVVQRESPSEYAALSYVRGTRNAFQATSENLNTLNTPNGLVQLWQDLPTTIKDAIEATKRVGLRYLWVDRLCIVENDDYLRHQALEKMDYIYSRAFVTIVAASGEDSEDRLPGIRVGSREEHMRIRIGPNMTLAGVPPLDLSLRNGRYTTRAWTFQELVLSPRSLIFCKDGFIFQCQKSCLTERIEKDTNFPPLTMQMEKLEPLPRAFASDSDLLQALVEGYTTRDLTREDDILNAFLGLSGTMKFLFGCVVRFGIPDIQIDWALLWQPIGLGLSRRRGFPSWSFMGWHGGCSFFDAGSRIGAGPSDRHRYIRLWASTCTWLNWKVFESSSKKFSAVFHRVDIPRSQTVVVPKDHPLAYLERDCHVPYPTSLTIKWTEDLLSQSSQQHQPSDFEGLLAFTTISARFRIISVPPNVASHDPGSDFASLFDTDGKLCDGLVLNTKDIGSIDSDLQKMNGSIVKVSLLSKTSTREPSAISSTLWKLLYPNQSVMGYDGRADRGSHSTRRKGGKNKKVALSTNQIRILQNKSNLDLSKPLVPHGAPLVPQSDMTLAEAKQVLDTCPHPDSPPAAVSGGLFYHDSKCICGKRELFTSC